MATKSRSALEARSQRKPSRLRRAGLLAVLALLLGFGPFLGGCDLLGSLGESFVGKPAVRLTIASATANPGQTIKVKISVEVLTDGRLAEIQVGPRGALVFDPKVLQVKSIVGVGGFSVFASEIDAAAGRARFAAASLSGGVREGEILELEVQVLGKAGERSVLKLTRVDLLLGERGEDLAPSVISNGQLNIE
ncbi:MAG: cohesin domain-containing protein [Candidatus Acetothermia bacterium]|jgi:hypothetical protein|nr:cohesin domain-containing protein [Candidatus Acetothermia bacterium]MDH7505997.1 cohesin domain-containing protein [Candidatus Acetothermia bacterium]